MARRKPGMSKATGYKLQVYNAAYDLNGIRLAYGGAFVRWLLVQLEDGAIDNMSMDNVLEIWYEHCAQEDAEEEYEITKERKLHVI